MSRRTIITNGTANLRAAGLPEIEAVTAAAAASGTLTEMATQQSKRKPKIVSVEQVGQSYEVTYDSGTTKKMIICKAPKTVLSWLEAHAAAEPESTMETAAADPEPETETTMEMEPVMESETPTPSEPESMESRNVTPSEPETITEPVKPAEPVRTSTGTTEPVREPHREPVSGLWITPLQLLTLIVIRIAQLGIFTAWLSVQAILAMMTAAATIRQAVPVIIGTVQSGYMALTAEVTTAAQSLTEATGAARRYWTEVYMDMRRDVPQVVRVGNKWLLRFGQTILSTIR